MLEFDTKRQQKELYSQLTIAIGTRIHEIVCGEMLLNERLGDVIISDSIPETTVPIKPQFLEVLVREVISNACKFSQQGTPVYVVLLANDETCTIIVNDKGRGLSTQQIRRIDAFMQFDRQEYEQQGVGLGLAIVKKILRLYHGKISIKSSAEEGTTVKLNIPMTVRQ